MNKLSVIIPAYNEAHRITKTLMSVSGFLEKQPWQYEILVVSDGSKDNTAETVNNLAKTLKNLTLVDNQQNHGKGWVVRQGMLKATGDVRLFMDADNSTSIDQVLPMLDYLNKGYDVIIGSIEVAGAKIDEHAQWYRRFIGHWSKYLIRAVAGIWEIHDSQRGFKLFSEKAARSVFSKAVIDRFGFDIEILALAKKLGFKIKELPVVWVNEGESKVSLKSYIEVFIDLWRIRFNLWLGRYK